MNDLADIGPPYFPQTPETILLVVALTVKVASKEVKEVQKALEYN
jgi:hypothetical protein